MLCTKHSAPYHSALSLSLFLPAARNTYWALYTTGDLSLLRCANRWSSPGQLFLPLHEPSYSSHPPARVNSCAQGREEPSRNTPVNGAPLQGKVHGNVRSLVSGPREWGKGWSTKPPSIKHTSNTTCISAFNLKGVFCTKGTCFHMGIWPVISSKLDCRNRATQTSDHLLHQNGPTPNQ